MADPAVSSTRRARSTRPAAGKRPGRNGGRRAAAAYEALARIREPIRQQIERAIESENFDVLIATLVAISRRRSAIESESLKRYVFQRLIEQARDAEQSKRLWGWTKLCAARPEVEARELACALLDVFWKDHRKEVERLTLNLARDENAEVRQYAAGTMARVIQDDFRPRLRYLQKWSRHPDPSVRRQVLIASVGVADPQNPERARYLLDLIEPHLGDRDPYVRRNLGPFALGQGLLRAYPEATLERFALWLRSDDEVVRWNLATALAAAVAVAQWKTSLDLLRVLAADPRRFVWGAASLALGNLAQLRAPEVEPILRRWMREPRLRVAVTSAMGGTVR